MLPPSCAAAPADRARAHRHHDVAVAHDGDGASAASRRSSSTKTGSTLPATRTARASARPSAATIGASPAGIDVGQHQHVDGRQHAHEILEQVARARVAMRLEREHEAPAGEAAARRFDRRRHLGGMVAVVVDQRERAAVERARRRSAGSGGRRRGIPRAPCAIAASATPTSRPMAIAASALRTLCTPGSVELDREIGAHALALGDESHAAADVLRRRPRASSASSRQSVRHDRLGDLAAGWRARSHRRRTARRRRRTAGAAAKSTNARLSFAKSCRTSPCGRRRCW